MAQLVALMSGVVLGGVAEVVGSNLARGKIFTASIGSVDSLYPYITIYKISLSQKSPHWLAKNRAKARPSIWRALSQCPGFILAKKGSPPTYDVIYKDNGLKKHSGSVCRV